MTARLAWQVMKTLPTAARTAIGVTHATATALSALVVVTTLIPVIAVCLVVLGAPPPEDGRLSPRGRRAGEPGRGSG
jgi:hypothetical protein